jgi:3',5'-cyclic-AMP phosphodiesterase
MDFMPFIKIVTLTDVHILPDNGRLIGIDPTERLRQAVDHINRTQGDAHLCIITGDLTHHGDPGSYAILKHELSKLEIPVRILIGNHDIRDNFLSAFPAIERDGNGFVQFHADVGGYRLIGLDCANQPRIEGTRKGAGNLGNGRLEFLEQALASAAGLPSIIFMHHPPFDSGFPGMDVIKLMEPDTFFSRIEGRNVRHIVCGHIHRSMSVSWRGIPATVYKSLVDQMPFDLVSNDTSLAIAEPPAYGVVLLAPELVVCHAVEFLSELAEGASHGNVAYA